MAAETEELVDLRVHRPLAALLVQRLQASPVSSNQVTIASGIIGMAAGIVIAVAGPLSPGWVSFAGLLIFFSVILDCADGQLARLRGEASLVGRALDGTIDILPITSVFIGFAVYLMRLGISPLYVVLVGLVAGLSWRLHASGYDLAKQLYIANTRPGTLHLSLPSETEIEAERQRLVAQGKPALALVMVIFQLYTKGQHGGRHNDIHGLDHRPMHDDAERALYRDLFTANMRCWSWNGIGFHHLLTYAAALVTPLWPTAILISWWIIIIPMNVLYAVTRRRATRLEARLAELSGV